MPDNTQARPVTLKTKGDYRTPYVKAGWESARKGQPLDYALLDRAPTRHAAMAYETGRQIVLALRVAGEAVPAWRAQSVTPTIQDAMRTAVLINKAHVLHGTGPVIVLTKTS